MNFSLDLLFWRNSVPLHIDICSNSGFLLERWILSFQKASEPGSPVDTSGEYATFLKSPSDSISDITDLILLTQSLYSEIRGLPLSSGVLESQDTKGGLSYSSRHDYAVDRSFHPAAQLSVFKFRAASGPNGTLLLRVVYDANLVGLRDDRKPTPPSIITNLQNMPASLRKLTLSPDTYTSPSFPPSLDTKRTDAGSIISAGSFVISPDSPRPDEQTPPPLELPNRQCATSPFPSPKTQKRVLSIARNRLEEASTLRKKHLLYSTSPTRRSSNLQFNYTELSESSVDLDGVDTDSHYEQTDAKVLSPDGIEIHRTYLEGDFVSDRVRAATGGQPAQPIAKRRESIPSELFGTFVGSYEESILIGRLSTTPSKPITFLAEIGVLATGKCKPHLKCPPHLCLDFPAYFYQLPEEDVPTPYVGTIDINRTACCGANEKLTAEPLEGTGYRLPNKGQLQILIKNPSCTAVKVFLIPYDFRDMPPNTKTFIRQKSYAIQKRKPSILVVDRLKFAIHLNFQMNLKRQLYLTSCLRVVFSPRPLETDEQLRIAYQTPTFPKYSPVGDCFPVGKDEPSRLQGVTWNSPIGRNMVQVQGR
ncbi:hypothetical protein HDU91_003690 [Kappamyces sp. JEL0680]|nr:hypothetical protein HDU91_003690 [Kappamyces sp. JEL0680]